MGQNRLKKKIYTDRKTVADKNGIIFIGYLKKLTVETLMKNRETGEKETLKTFNNVHKKIYSTKNKLLNVYLLLINNL